MSKNKRIGIAMPIKDNMNSILNGDGLVSSDVRESLLKKLYEHVDVVDVVTFSISDAYVENGKVYADGVCLSELDLICWFYVISSNPADWDLLMLNALSQTTTVVPKPAGVMNGLNKFRAHSLLRNAGMPTADFSLFKASDVALAAKRLRDWGTILLKPELGSFGHGIKMVKSERELVDAVQYAQSFVSHDLHIFCERFEANDLSKWISTTIIDGELIYGYRKKLEKFVDGWKVYDACRAGGGVDCVDPTPVKDIALQSAKILGADIIGFDFIFSEDRQEYVIVDENTLPGMYGECFKKSGQGCMAEHFYRMVCRAL